MRILQVPRRPNYVDEEEELEGLLSEVDESWDDGDATNDIVTESNLPESFASFLASPIRALR